MAGQKVIVSVLADTKAFTRSMKRLGDVTGLTKLKNATVAAGKAMAKLTAAGAAALTAISVKAVSAASSLEQSMGTVNDIFKAHADTVHGYAKSAATDVGLSANSYNELANILGSQLKNGGTAIDELAGKTNDLITLGADLSAGFGGSTVDAVNAISSALKGERDPIERYGVSLRQATIDAKAAELGFRKVGGALSSEVEQAATLSLIMEQTTDMHGKFGRESNTLQHNIEVLKAKLENAAAAIGGYLIPAVTAAVTWLSDKLGPAFTALQTWIETTAAPAVKRLADQFNTNVRPALERLGNEVKTTVLPVLSDLGSWLTGTVVPALIDLGGWLVRNRDWLVPLAAAITGAVAAWRAYQQTLLMVQAAKTAVAAAQTVLNAALKANPIGIVITLIAGLIAGLIALWHSSETFRDIVTGVWETVKGAFTAAGEIIGGVVSAITTFFTVTIPGAFNSAMSSASSAMSSIGATISNGLNTVITFFAGLPGRVLGALASFGSLLIERGKALLSGLKSGVTTGITTLMSTFTGLPGKIVGWLGNLGSTLVNAGSQLISGFVNGIKNAFGSVKDSLGNLTSKLTSWKGPPKRDRVLLRNNGRLVMQGFLRGLEGEYSTVRRSLAGFTGSLSGSVTAGLSGSLNLAGPGSAAPSVHVELHTLRPDVDTARAVHSALKQYQTMTGRRA